MFVDEVKIKVKAGDGGNGVVAWERHKYIPKGGPGGGDGGKGGDVIFQADERLNTLVYFSTHKLLKAENGGAGMSHKKRGKGGENLVVKVPVGTLIWDEGKEVLVADLAHNGDEVSVAYGGDGGYGNAHFVSSVRQAPEIAEFGEPGEERDLKLELRLVADVGLVGLPNVGKSTLLSVVTKAKPKIANYPFTTLTPNLGVVETLPNGKPLEGFGFVIADIPGLIEGAAEGKGLGDEFLRHVQRTRILAHIIAATSSDYLNDFEQINAELKAYNEELAKKPMVLAISQIDAVLEEDLAEKLQCFKAGLKSLKTPVNIVNKEPYLFSGVTREGLNDLLFALNDELAKIPKTEETEIEDYKEYTLEDRASGFDVYEEGGAFRVVGAKVEKFAIRTDFTNPAAMFRFRHILKRMGVEQALKKAGVKDGDTVYVNEKSFGFKEF